MKRILIALTIASIFQHSPSMAADDFVSLVTPIQVRTADGQSQIVLAATLGEQVAITACSALRDAIALTTPGSASGKIKLIGVRALDNVCMVQPSTGNTAAVFARRDAVGAGVELVALLADAKEATGYRRHSVTVDRKSFSGKGRAIFLNKSENALDGALLFLPNGALVGVASAINGTSGEFAATLLESKDSLLSMPRLPNPPSSKASKGEATPTAILKPHAESIGTLFSLMNLAEYYTRTMDYEKAVVLSEKWRSIEPDNPAAWAVGATALSRMQFTENAFKDLDKALTIDPTYPPVLFAKAALLYKVGKPTEGELEANKAVPKVQITDSLDEAAVVGLLLAGKKADEARVRERALAKKEPRELFIRSMVCNVELFGGVGGDLDLALEACRGYVERVPESAIGWVHLAEAYLRKGRFDDSTSSAKHALSISIESADAWRVLGVAAEMKGDAKAAAEAEQRISEYEPSMVARYKSARSMASCRREFGEKTYTRAVAACQEAVQLNERNAQAQGLLGAALLRDKRLDEGIAAHERAVALDPKQKGSWRDLAMAYAQKKDMTRARAAVEKLASLDKPAADELVARLRL